MPWRMQAEDAVKYAVMTTTKVSRLPGLGHPCSATVRVNGKSILECEISHTFCYFGDNCLPTIALSVQTIAIPTRLARLHISIH
jgi:hypothetical protein